MQNASKVGRSRSDTITGVVRPAEARDRARERVVEGACVSRARTRESAPAAGEVSFVAERGMAKSADMQQWAASECKRSAFAEVASVGASSGVQLLPVKGVLTAHLLYA